MNALDMLFAQRLFAGMPQIPQPAPSLPMLPSMPAPPSEIVPPAPIDQNAILQRFANLAGPAPAPTPPVQQQPGFLDKLATILQGISAGAQGQGPQYAQSIREQRERPQREYQRQLQEYRDRTARLGLAGEEAVSQAQARREQRLAEQDDKFFQRERDEMIRRTGMQDREAIARLEASLTAERDARLARRAEEEEQRRVRTQQERDARLIARDYGKLTDNPKIAQELGRYYAGLTDNLSPAAARFESAQARIAEARARRAAGGPSDSLAGISVETEMGVIPLKAYAALKDVLGPPKRFIMPGGTKVGAGEVQFTIQDAQAQVKEMEKNQKTPTEINAVIDAMIKDNPKMSLQLQGLKRQAPLVPTGPDLRSPEERRKELPINQFIQGAKERYRQSQTPEARRRAALEFQG